MSIFKRSLIALLFLMPAPALAQDYGNDEIVVTASRRESDGFDETRPVIGLRRPADFAILEVTIAGDTRDEAKRQSEIMAMVRSAIELAPKHGVELATGDEVVEPLTVANFRDLGFTNDNRPDTDRVSFMVKVRLGSGVDGATARDRVQKFIKAVPAVGRAEIRGSGDDLTLSIVGPDKFRGEILDIVAADAKAVSGRLGPDYGVELRGLDRPVEWTQVGLTDVFLYVPYNMVVRPKSN
ncbi:TonB-dependent receptor [Sphingomonas sp. G-3-2-10]|uniref:TonB-dependent receptor n=1 Tax=Sphingomonas sp. G-3-2-10 TaxID=2728838 RepID=UPI00146D43F8|nr:TonB-dependent receptor [Sphingomonas sp. G-3-2-10]NML05017.1 TonB-dependent receptor [Sphingomonas sp. G-3-2-10]